MCVLSCARVTSLCAWGCTFGTCSCGQRGAPRQHGARDRHVGPSRLARTCDVRVNERCKRHTDTTLHLTLAWTPRTCTRSTRTPCTSVGSLLSHFRAGGGSKSPHRHSLLSPLSARQTDRTHGRSFCSSFCSRGGSSGLFSGLFEVSVCWRIWSVRLLFKEISSAVLKLTHREGWHYDIVLPAAPRRRFANSVRVCHAWDVCVFRMYLPYGGQSTAGIVQQDAPVRSQHGQP